MTISPILCNDQSCYQTAWVLPYGTLYTIIMIVSLILIVSVLICFKSTSKRALSSTSSLKSTFMLLCTYK